MRLVGTMAIGVGLTHEPGPLDGELNGGDAAGLGTDGVSIAFQLSHWETTNQPRVAAPEPSADWRALGMWPAGHQMEQAFVARPTGVGRADASSIRIPVEGADIGLVADLVTGFEGPVQSAAYVVVRTRGRSTPGMT